MERRGFLKTILAGLAATSLPISALEAPAPSAAIWNAESLTAALENMFACQMGPAMSFYEVSKKTGEIIHVNPENAIEGHVNALQTEKPDVFKSVDGDRIRRHYVTYVCGIEGGSAEEAEARLAKHFYEEFSKLPSGGIVWRTKPHFETVDVTKYGDTWATREQIEDRLYMYEEYVDEHGHKRTRFNPNAELVIPKDVELDFNSGSYKHVIGRVQLHKMRMRLVLPHLDDSGVYMRSLVKPEGAKINRMV